MFPEPKNHAEYLQLLNDVAAKDHAYPGDKFSGRGIVISAGGERYFTNAYVCVNILRMLGCNLPIQFWHLGPAEMTDEMREIVKPLGVECIDAYEVRKEYPVRTLNGWELKPFAIIHSRFEEVLALDADNVAALNPEFLFDTPEYQKTGAIFWPDYGRLGKARLIWELTGVSYRDEPEFESGQIIVDKRRCWKALQVTMHLNEYSNHYYNHVHGDKETFHIAWRKIEQEYSMPERGIHSLAGTMCQHDFYGQRVFQHRNMRKWQLNGRNDAVNDFMHEAECLRFVDDLRSQWSAALKSSNDPAFAALISNICAQQFYTYYRVGYDQRVLQLLPNNRICSDSRSDCLEHTWAIAGTPAAPQLVFVHENRALCTLRPVGAGMFYGQWNMFEKMPVFLAPAPVPALTLSEQEKSRNRLGVIEQTAPGSKKLLITGYYGAAYEALAARTVPEMRKYAAKHGYDFAVCDVRGARPSSWYKLLGLISGLETYDAVLWLDADVLITQHDRDIADDIPSTAVQGLARHQTEQGDLPNCGVWFVRAAMRETLQQIWDEAQFIYHGWWEQAALATKLGYHVTQGSVALQTPTPLYADTAFISTEWNHCATAINAAANYRFLHLFSSIYPARLNAAVSEIIEDTPGVNPFVVDVNQLGIDYTHSWAMDLRHVDTIYAILKEVQPACVVEIGCYQGVSTCAIIQALAQNYIKRAHLVDIAIQPTVRQLVRDGVFVHEKTSVDALEAISDADDLLVIIDGDHRYPAVSEELPRVLAKNPKVIVAHDVTTETAGSYGDCCNGSIWLWQELQTLGWTCFIDCRRRDGERTERGLLAATRDPMIAATLAGIFNYMGNVPKR